jgi:hypothetical protein
MYTQICIKEGQDMTSKNITLSVDEEIYNKYRDYCKKKGWLMSRQFEIFMEEQLKENLK